MVRIHFELFLRLFAESIALPIYNGKPETNGLKKQAEISRYIYDFSNIQIFILTINYIIKCIILSAQ